MIGGEVPPAVLDSLAQSVARRRREQFEFEDRYDKEPEPPFSEEERHELFRLHTPVRAKHRPFYQFPPEAPSYLYCVTCGEEWKNGGCSTIRALHLLARRSGIAIKAIRRNYQLEVLLADHRSILDIRTDPSRRVLVLKIEADVVALRVGGNGFLEALARKVYDELKQQIPQKSPEGG